VLEVESFDPSKRKILSICKNEQMDFEELFFGREKRIKKRKKKMEKTGRSKWKG